MLSFPQELYRRAHLHRFHILDHWRKDPPSLLDGNQLRWHLLILALPQIWKPEQDNLSAGLYLKDHRLSMGADKEDYEVQFLYLRFLLLSTNKLDAVYRWWQDSSCNARDRTFTCSYSLLGRDYLDLGARLTILWRLERLRLFSVRDLHNHLRFQPVWNRGQLRDHARNENHPGHSLLR